MMPSRARRASSLRQAQVVPRSKISALNRLRVGRPARRDQIAPHLLGREREHHRGLALAAMNVGSGADRRRQDRTDAGRTALSPKSPRSSCSRFSRMPRLPPWPLTIARLRAGSARTIVAREIAQIAR